MKIFLGIALLFSIQLNAQRHIDVLHYKYSLNLNDANDNIEGRATITLVSKNKDLPVILDLTNVKNGKGMVVSEIRTGRSGFKGIDYTHENDKLIISQSSFTISDTVTLKIYYKGIPADGLIISKNKFDKRTFFADNWPNRAHNWIPCVDDPADKASVEFIVTAPRHYRVISNGIQIEESNWGNDLKVTHWKETIPLPTKVMVIGVADFAVNLAGEVDCVPVSSWVYPDNKFEGFYDYAQARDVLAFYIDYIGPFPYKKLANVQSKTIFGGMENAGAIFYFENSVTGKREEEPLLAHEIVHQWFGDMATEKAFSHLWLSEGFATYLTHVYMQSRYGDSVFKERLLTDRDKVLKFVSGNPKPVVDSASSFMELLNPNSYEKGSWVLHMLRQQTGDSVFHKIIRTYYERYKGSTAETSDFRKVAEEISGKKLDVFFQQWLFTPANPKLTITWKYDANKKGIRVIVRQIHSQLFTFPLDLRLNLPGTKTLNKEVRIEQREQEFIILVTEKPLELIADPNVKLLFEGEVTDSK